MAEDNGVEDIFSPTGSSPASEDIFSAGPESELAGSTGESPYAFTSSATISLFSSGSQSEDQQIQDFLGPNLAGHIAAPSGHGPLQSNGGPLEEDAHPTSSSSTSSVAPSSSSEESSPVSLGGCSLLHVVSKHSHYVFMYNTELN